MEVEKDIWTEKDFDVLGWHDATIYSIVFDYPNYQMIFDTDYILEWKSDLTQYRVTKSKLIFNNIHGLKISLDFGMTFEIIIMDIERSDKRYTPNQKFEEWKYKIITELGEIEFYATGFTMWTDKLPEWSNSQVIGR